MSEAAKRRDSQRKSVSQADQLRRAQDEILKHGYDTLRQLTN